MDALNNIDAQGKNITIDVGEGDWETLNFGYNPPVGCPLLTLQGSGRDTKFDIVTARQGTPTMTIKNIGAKRLNNYHLSLTLQDTTLTGNPGGHGISAGAGRLHIDGTVVFEGEYSTGLLTNSGSAIVSNATLVFNSPVFSSRCLSAYRGSSISFVGGSYNGSFTGVKYLAYNGGAITWYTAALNPDNLPGTLPGGTGNTGTYIGAVGISKGGCGILGTTGALINATGAVIASTRVSTGTYEITFSQDIGVSSRGVGSIQTAAPGSVSCKRVSATKYAVYVYNATGVLTDLDCGLNFYW